MPILNIKRIITDHIPLKPSTDGRTIGELVDAAMVELLSVPSAGYLHEVTVAFFEGDNVESYIDLAVKMQPAHRAKGVKS